MTTSPSAPDLSIVIPVLDEVHRINPLLAHLRRLDAGGGCEIIVVDGDPDRLTLAAIQDRRAIGIGTLAGRGRQMNAGAEVARGEILLFLHADTWLPATGLTRIRQLLADPACVGGAFRLRFDSRRWRHALLGRLANWRTLVTGIPFGDQAIFLRRRFFRSLGGYRDLPIMEDVDLMRRVRRRGGRFRLLDECVLTSARRMEREGVTYCVLRGILLHGLFGLGLPPRWLKRLYPVVTDGMLPAP